MQMSATMAMVRTSNGHSRTGFREGLEAMVLPCKCTEEQSIRTVPLLNYCASVKGCRDLVKPSVCIDGVKWESRIGVAGGGSLPLQTDGGPANLLVHSFPHPAPEKKQECGSPPSVSG